MVKQTFQWFFDFATEPDTMQILTVKAGGKRVIQRLAPFFSAYKYFKLGKVSLKAVPASTLPVDPTGLSYEAGENTVDPRDQLSPGLMRITNGEQMQKDLTGVPAVNQRLIYANMLLDRRWFKWSLQSGFKKSAVPLAWHVAQLHEDLFPGNVNNVPISKLSTGANDEPVLDSVFSNMSGRTYKQGDNPSYSYQSQGSPNYSSPYGLFQTGKNVRFGWLPTDAYQPMLVKKMDDTGTVTLKEVPAIHPVPEVELFNIITPPAYKTKYYYRVYVTETVFFSEPVTNGIGAFVDESGFEVSAASLDRFTRPKLPQPEKATTVLYDAVEHQYIKDMNDGHGEHGA